LYVLTAAHCTTYVGRRPTIVRLQDINLAEEDANDVTINILVTYTELIQQSSTYTGYTTPYFSRSQTIIKHPEYTISRKYNDIALLRLSSSVEFTGDLYPACLWNDVKEDELLETSRISSCGFGITGNGSE
jgi:Trypsin